MGEFPQHAPFYDTYDGSAVYVKGGAWFIISDEPQHLVETHSYPGMCQLRDEGKLVAIFASQERGQQWMARRDAYEAWRRVSQSQPVPVEASAAVAEPVSHVDPPFLDNLPPPDEPTPADLFDQYGRLWLNPAWRWVRTHSKDGAYIRPQYGRVRPSALP